MVPLLLSLFLAHAEPSGVPVALPPGQAAAWAGALALQGWRQGAATGDVWVLLAPAGNSLELSVRGRDGTIRRRVVPAPRSEADREDILALARGLLRAGESPTFSLALPPEPEPTPEPPVAVVPHVRRRPEAASHTRAPIEAPVSRQAPAETPPATSTAAVASPPASPRPPGPPEAPTPPPWAPPGPAHHLDTPARTVFARAWPEAHWGFEVLGGVGVNGRRLVVPVPHLRAGLIGRHGNLEVHARARFAPRTGMTDVEEGAHVVTGELTSGIGLSARDKAPFAGLHAGLVARHYGIDGESIATLPQALVAVDVGGRTPVSETLDLRVSMALDADLGWTLITGDNRAITLGRLGVTVQLDLAGDLIANHR